MTQRAQKPLIRPRHVRFPADIDDELQKIADANGLAWVDAVRMAAKAGLPIIKKRMSVAVKEAA